MSALSLARFLACFAGLMYVAADRAAPASSAAAPEARIEIFSRALVPGEAVRIRARFDESAASVHGSFLDREVTFLPAAASSGASAGREWWAWGVVPLGERPGRGKLVVTSRSPQGIERRAETAVRIRAKDFPTQPLKVESRFVSPAPETLERIERERRELAAVYGSSFPGKLPSRPFSRPVPGPPTSTFGARRIFNGQPRDPHPGLDLKAPEGTAVRASGPGIVRVARDLYYSGGTVILDHGGGLFTVYAHLSRMDVSEGDEVRQDQPLGSSGATGRVTGPHLHWGAKVGDVPADPRSLLDPALFP